MERGVEFCHTLWDLRERGWRVAVHNDYRVNGRDMTFWLFTHPDGRYVKGEGPTDMDALVQCCEKALPRSVRCPDCDQVLFEDETCASVGCPIQGTQPTATFPSR